MGVEEVPAEDVRAEVRGAYERYLAAFMDNDLPGLDAVLSYPLTYVGDDGARSFDALPVEPAELRRMKGWHTTTNLSYDVVAVSPRKAHVLLHHADRLRADGSLLETISAFYVFIRTDRGWRLCATSDVVNPPG